MKYRHHTKRFTRRIQKGLTARTWLYLACHAILVLTGLILMLIDSDSVTTRKYLNAIGGSLVAMGVGGAVLFLMVWLDRKESRRVHDIREYGLNRIFSVRSVGIKVEYDRRLAHASKAIDIMGFGLRHLREDYGSDFQQWAEKATVRILMLDPDFPSKNNPIADLRDVEEKNDRGEIKKDVMRMIRMSGDIVKDNNLNFRIRLYRCLPSINLFRIDQDVFWGPYFVGDVSRNMPTFLMEGGGRLSSRLIEHFDQIWASEEFSREVPKEWLGKQSTSSD